MHINNRRDPQTHRQVETLPILQAVGGESLPDQRSHLSPNDHPENKSRYGQHLTLACSSEKFLHEQSSSILKISFAHDHTNDDDDHQNDS